jgi:aerotolerance regulator-like protein/VWA domain-containing protein
MHFIAPSLLLGLLAAVLPSIIHRIGRRRARPVRFAAMQLLLSAEREVSARRRLRDALLLVVRTGLAAALPLAFARPFADVQSDLPAVSGRSQTAVIVLDDSASMRRRFRDGTPFDLAKARARSLVEHLSADSEVALVLASEGTTTPIAEPSSDHSRVAQAIDALSCSARRADFGAALRRAGQILGSGVRADRLIYVFTDLQAAGWDSYDRTAIAGNPQTVVLDASEGQNWENRAVVGLSAEPAPEAGSQGVAVVAEIADFGPTGARKLGISLALDGVEVGRAFVDVPPNGRARKRFVLTVAGGGAHEAEVTLDHDVFPLDDTRACRVEASRGLRALVVDGDPRTVRTEDEVFFLEAALRAGGSNFATTTVLPDELVGRDLGAYGVVFLANVNRVPPGVAADLVHYVESGGGVFISVGDRVDTEAWNQSLHAILPQPLGLKRSAAALPGGRPEGETIDLRPAERLGPIDRRHPLLSAFPARDEGLASARFFEFMLLEPVADAPGRRVVLRFEGGAPALVDGELGRGRVLLYTSTVDREWTDLPIRPGFLPLVQEAARYLAGAPSADAATAIEVGDKRPIALEPEDRRIEVLKPGGSSRWLTPGSADDTRGSGAARGNRVVTFVETDEPGYYRVRAARVDGSLIDRPDAAFVVNLDARESDPARLPDDRRPDRAPTGAAPGRAPRRRLELWHAVGAVVIGLVLIESLLTLRLRRGRARA